MEPNPTEGQCRSVGGPAGSGSPLWRRSRCPLSFPWPFLIPQALDVPGFSEGATAAPAVQWRTKPRQAGTAWDGDGLAKLISLLFIYFFFFSEASPWRLSVNPVFSCTQMMWCADRNAVDESLLCSGMVIAFFSFLLLWKIFLSPHSRPLQPFLASYIHQQHIWILLKTHPCGPTSGLRRWPASEGTTAVASGEFFSCMFCFRSCCLVFFNLKPKSAVRHIVTKKREKYLWVVWKERPEAEWDMFESSRFISEAFRDTPSEPCSGTMDP